MAHGGSVYWNAYRNRWVMITVESFGSTSMLGEIWYAEADTPLGPWVYARKVVTHDKYSFYNPKQHPMFDKDGGRIIFFEGTYTTTFSGNHRPDASLRLQPGDVSARSFRPSAGASRGRSTIAARPEAAGRLAPKAAANGRSLDGRAKSGVLRTDREGIATLPVYEEYDVKTGQTLRVGAAGRRRTRPVLGLSFSCFPPTSRTTRRRPLPLYELTPASGGARVYSTDARSAQWSLPVDVESAGPRLEEPGDFGVLVSREFNFPKVRVQPQARRAGCASHTTRRLPFHPTNRPEARTGCGRRAGTDRGLARTWQRRSACLTAESFSSQATRAGSFALSRQALCSSPARAIASSRSLCQSRQVPLAEEVPTDASVR